MGNTSPVSTKDTPDCAHYTQHASANALLPAHQQQRIDVRELLQGYGAQYVAYLTKAAGMMAPADGTPLPWSVTVQDGDGKLTLGGTLRLAPAAVDAMLNSLAKAGRLHSDISFRFHLEAVPLATLCGGDDSGPRGDPLTRLCATVQEGIRSHRHTGRHLDARARPLPKTFDVLVQLTGFVEGLGVVGTRWQDLTIPVEHVTDLLTDEMTYEPALV